MQTTIKLSQATKQRLEQFREYKNESYDELVQKLSFIAEKLPKEPELSAETLEAIRKAKERINKGIYVTEDEAWKRLAIRITSNSTKKQSKH